MDRKKLWLLVGALIVAIGTAFMARTLFAGAAVPKADAAPARGEGTQGLVAQRALPVGTIITADAVAYQAWPKDMVQDAYFLNGEGRRFQAAWNGGPLSRSPRGEPVTQGSLVKPGDRGFLAAALGPGCARSPCPSSPRPASAASCSRATTSTSCSRRRSRPRKASRCARRKPHPQLRVLATDQSTETEITEGKTVVKAFRP
jgi:pilus assembly protein CpaB